MQLIPRPHQQTDHEADRRSSQVHEQPALSSELEPGGPVRDTLADVGYYFISRLGIDFGWLRRQCSPI